MNELEKNRLPCKAAPLRCISPGQALGKKALINLDALPVLNQQASLPFTLQEQDPALSLPAYSIFKEPNTTKKEPRELKTDSYGWVERKSSTALPNDPSSSQPQ